MFLDVDEMNLVQYDVKIGDQPIVLNDKDPQPPVQVISISLKIFKSLGATICFSISTRMMSFSCQW